VLSHLRAFTFETKKKRFEHFTVCQRMNFLITAGYQQQGKFEDFSLLFGISPHQDEEGCGHGEKCPISQTFTADLSLLRL
jgi:hypothetical protein